MAKYEVDYVSMVRTSVTIEASDDDEAAAIVDELNESGLFYEDYLQPRLERQGISADETEVSDVRRIYEDDAPATLDRHRLGRYSRTAQRAIYLDMALDAMVANDYDRVRMLLGRLEKLDAQE